MIVTMVVLLLTFRMKERKLPLIHFHKKAAISFFYEGKPEKITNIRLGYTALFQEETKTWMHTAFRSARSTGCRILRRSSAWSGWLEMEKGRFVGRPRGYGYAKLTVHVPYSAEVRMPGPLQSRQ
ncbi:hypothetical protein ACVNS2_23445 [Paenibacillus caseinilyticus]|uniref:hypothetical protein n=1 Tax=Paenibacillus mucilaginosus TaxID=61624 RepID=UPI0019D3BA14|nr:hypothetical protein [Paenibacillus mucilaginosus]